MDKKVLLSSNEGNNTSRKVLINKKGSLYNAHRKPSRHFKRSPILLYREALNLSQKDVYEAIGVSDVCYRAWENGKFLPTGQNLYKLAEVLKVSPEQIVGKEVFPGATIDDLKSFYETKDEKFSQALKFLREKKKFSQRYISDALGVPRTTFSNWEQGKCLPSQESFQIIFKKLSEGE